jgi:hypothetical protein
LILPFSASVKAIGMGSSRISVLLNIIIHLISSIQFLLNLKSTNWLVESTYRYQKPLELFASSPSLMTSTKALQQTQTVRSCVENNYHHQLLSAIISVTHLALVQKRSSACCPSECKCVDKIPLVKSSSTQYSRSCSISKNN